MDVLESIPKNNNHYSWLLFPRMLTLILKDTKITGELIDYLKTIIVTDGSDILTNAIIDGIFDSLFSLNYLDANNFSKKSNYRALKHHVDKFNYEDKLNWTMTLFKMNKTEDDLIALSLYEMRKNRDNEVDQYYLSSVISMLRL